VTLRDDDAGETLPTAMLFPTRLAALTYALEVYRKMNAAERGEK
jgi:hypothetical protein